MEFATTVAMAEAESKKEITIAVAEPTREEFETEMTDWKREESGKPTREEIEAEIARILPESLREWWLKKTAESRNWSGEDLKAMFESEEWKKLFLQGKAVKALWPNSGDVRREVILVTTRDGKHTKIGLGFALGCGKVIEAAIAQAGGTGPLYFSIDTTAEVLEKIIGLQAKVDGAGGGEDELVLVDDEDIGFYEIRDQLYPVVEELMVDNLVMTLRARFLSFLEGKTIKQGLLIMGADEETVTRIGQRLGGLHMLDDPILSYE